MRDDDTTCTADATWQEIGWYGVLVRVPGGWNLSFHEGDARRGMMVLSDLRGPVVEVRWREPRRWGVVRVDGRRALRDLVARLRRKGEVEALEEGYVLRERSLVVAADGRRVYEMHFPRKVAEWMTVATSFVNAVSEGARATEWRWAVYGVRESLPKTARLREVSLKPGECRLGFTHAGPSGRRGETAMLGTSALADRLLERQSLRAWGEATLACVRRHGAGTWEVSADRAMYRVEGRRYVHEVSVAHDRAQNRICWTHWVKRAKT